MMIKKYSQKQREIIKETVRGIFRNQRGKPYELTDGEADIFLSVIDPRIKWLWISAPTRYGKTDIIAMAFLYLAAYKNLKLPVVGGSEDKSKKIMEYVVQHVADHHTLYDGLLNVTDVTDVDRLKVTVSKTALRWRDGGWIYITSVDARGIHSEGEKVVGEGGDIVLLEEAGLIRRQEQFSKVVRMPEEDRGWGKLIMSGNCVEDSVFETAWKDPLYTKVRIDLDQAVAEGRYTWDFLNQKKTQTTGKDWKRYYLVEFPDRSESAYFKPRKYEALPREFTPEGTLIPLKFYGAIDPSLGELGKAQADKRNQGSKIGIIVLAKDTKGTLFEVESIIEHLEPDNAIKKIFSMPYSFVKFVFEAIQFQKYFLKVTQDLSKRLGLQIPFQGINQSKAKTERIESLEPFINNGDILFKGDNQLWNDLLNYPDVEFMDGLDALEMAFRSAGNKKVSFIIGEDTY